MASEDENCRRSATFGSRNGFRHAPKVDASTLLVGGCGPRSVGVIRTRGMEPVGDLARAGINAKVRAGIVKLGCDWAMGYYVASRMADASTNADALGLLDHPSQSLY